VGPGAAAIRCVKVHVFCLEGCGQETALLTQRAGPGPESPPADTPRGRDGRKWGGGQKGEWERYPGSQWSIGEQEVSPAPGHLGKKRTWGAVPGSQNPRARVGAFAPQDVPGDVNSSATVGGLLRACCQVSASSGGHHQCWAQQQSFSEHVLVPGRVPHALTYVSSLSAHNDPWRQRPYTHLARRRPGPARLSVSWWTCLTASRQPSCSQCHPIQSQCCSLCRTHSLEVLCSKHQNVH
jgi:hypothetical protein